ncbi:MAG: hypothetical protein JXR80_01155 [Deltaproteobacteria bacterium]|nr:hypothetical protein [Deltaproteobacteria bacterium]
MNFCKTTQMFLIGCTLTLLLSTGGSSPAVAETQIAPAIKKYDTVAYFRDGKALPGNEPFTFQWHNLIWYFASRENLDLFAAGPEKYAPQYDGYCAWAMSENRQALTDPQVWKIVDDKLYLNCSQTAYEKWSRDIPGNIRKADHNWLNFRGQ